MANELKIDGKYTVKGARAILGIGESTIWRWIKEGKLNPVYQQARVLFSAREIDELANHFRIHQKFKFAPKNLQRLPEATKKEMKNE